MHIAGKCILSRKDEHYDLDVLVADVFDDNNEIKAMIVFDTNVLNELPKDISDFDTMTLQTLFLGYGMVIITKEFVFDVDYNNDFGTIRAYINFGNDNTVLTTADGRVLADAEPINEVEIEKYVNALRNSHKKWDKMFEEKTGD